MMVPGRYSDPGDDIAIRELLRTRKNLIRLVITAMIAIVVVSGVIGWKSGNPPQVEDFQAEVYLDFADSLGMEDAQALRVFAAQLDLREEFTASVHEGAFIRVRTSAAEDEQTEALRALNGEQLVHRGEATRLRVVRDATAAPSTEVVIPGDQMERATVGVTIGIFASALLFLSVLLYADAQSKNLERMQKAVHEAVHEALALQEKAPQEVDSESEKRGRGSGGGSMAAD